MRLKPAPEWDVSLWFNVPEAIKTLQPADFRGRVLVLHTFQMLCPGCVSLALPQAQKVHTMFAQDEVAVVGLHTVFEHHTAMQPHALKAFIHEYRLTFPIGVDRHDGGATIPNTMEAYQLCGTPGTVLIDKQGYLRLAHFGQVDSLELGKMIGLLLGERPDVLSGSENHGAVCTPEGCD